MRVTSNMMMANSLYNIGNNMRRLDKAQQQQSTQSKIQLPSDDPEVATQAVKYRDYVSSVTQYQKNVEDAAGWMKVSEGTLNDLHDVVQKMRELTVKASNTGTMNPANLDAIKQEVAQLKKTAVQILNISYAGRYIFAGYETDKEPFAMTTVTAGGSTIDRVTYKGKIMDMSGAISPDVDAATYAKAYGDAVSSGKAYQDTGARQSLKYNVGFNSQLIVNVEGHDIIGTDPAQNLFTTIDKLMLGLEGKKNYQSITNAGGTVKTTSFTLSSILGDLDSDLDRISAVNAGLGARENTAGIAGNRLGDDKMVYTKLMAANESVDAGEAEMNAATAKVVYESSLAATAKAVSKSLLDYLG